MVVSILREASLIFRRIFLELGETDPFLEASTIDAACSRMFRKKYLQKDTIGIIPYGGYRKADNHSKSALKWMIYEEDKIKPEKIVHAGRAREHYIKELGIHVGGYRQSEKEKHVYNFHGCYWHGHTCLKIERTPEIEALFKKL